MRLKSITLKWFRGAGSEACLPLNGRPAVIFGANGAGKSSFVDAVEAVLCDGKVGHLGHEYSGRNQEKGLSNTARPAGAATEIELALSDNSTTSAKWSSASASFIVTGGSNPRQWDYRRTALRQEELADFIRSTKGEKYSTLLPLLGLSSLEVAAENLHRLASLTEKESNLQTLRAKFDAAIELRKNVFGDKPVAHLAERLRELKATYAADVGDSSSQVAVDAILGGIQQKIESLSADSRRAATVGEIASSALLSMLAQARSHSAQIADLAEPLIQQRLGVLLSTNDYLQAGIQASGTMACPACGKDIEADYFRQHIQRERAKLTTVAALYDAYHIEVGGICDELSRLKNLTGKADLLRWRNSLAPEPTQGVNHLDNLAIGELRKGCSAADLDGLEEQIGPLLRKAISDAVQLPPQVETLIDDQNQARALQASLDATTFKTRISRIDALVSLTKALESQIRYEIRDQARATFDSISDDVRTFFGVLQPNDVIANIRLEVPTDSEKAIEVYLRFHGKELESPRLTLSEGQRNALGLCIFLAMANRAAVADTPVVLDDVVISFDREHRSKVATLLTQKFANRQVMLFTHDREWYFELQRMLPAGRWDFHRLVPFSDPATGIRFADVALDFETARQRAKTEPEEALANVRRMMDVALSELAERIGLPVHHVRGDNNDHRTAGEFLIALERVASKSFQIKEGAAYISSPRALDAVRKVKPDLAVWGNRGTHTFSASTTEAEELIDASEELLRTFTCDSCGSSIGAVDGNGGKLECRCGQLRWRPN